MRRHELTGISLLASMLVVLAGCSSYKAVPKAGMTQGTADLVSQGCIAEAKARYPGVVLDDTDRLAYWKACLQRQGLTSRACGTIVC